MDIVVEPLSSHPGAVPMAAEWHFSEWGHTDPGGALEGWTAGLARQAGASRAALTAGRRHRVLVARVRRKPHSFGVSWIVSPRLRRDTPRGLAVHVPFTRFPRPGTVGRERDGPLERGTWNR